MHKSQYNPEKEELSWGTMIIQTVWYWYMKRMMEHSTIQLNPNRKLAYDKNVT